MPAATGCSATFASTATVTLAAKAKSGSSFVGWLGACTGLVSCRPVMSQNRSATARFLKGPFTLKIAGGGSGTGSGRVRSQTGLSPAINCAITSGAAAASGCSASYPAGTAVTLTATATTGHTFAGWSTPCAGSGNCQLTVRDPRTVFVAFSPAGTNASAVRGKWGTPFATNVLAVHAHLLPTGKVFFWGKQGQARLWDPAHPTAAFVDVTKAYPIYCTGHTFLSRWTTAHRGGSLPTSGKPKGDSRGAIYDPATNGWSTAAAMAQGRYYPTLLALPSGRILAVSGSDQTGAVVTVPEIGDGVSWQRLTGATLAIPEPDYPAMFIAPNGKVFLAGFPATSRYLSVEGTGGWTAVADRKVADRTMGSAVMYAPGKILYVGGGDPPTNSAKSSISTRARQLAAGGADALRAASDQRHILADGSILVTNGTSGPGSTTSPARCSMPSCGIRPPNRGRSWRGRARDGRTTPPRCCCPTAGCSRAGAVKAGGWTTPASQLTLQVFSPPVSVQRRRHAGLAAGPHLGAEPTVYEQSFTVQTPSAASVTRGTLIRLSLGDPRLQPEPADLPADLQRPRGAAR